MKVKSESEVTQSCPTPRDPMDCSLPGSSIHGIFQARVLEWGAITFSEHLSLLRCYSYVDVSGVLAGVVGVTCFSHLQSKYPCQLVEGMTGPEVHRQGSCLGWGT